MHSVRSLPHRLCTNCYNGNRTPQTTSALAVCPVSFCQRCRKTAMLSKEYFYPHLEYQQNGHCRPIIPLRMGYLQNSEILFYIVEDNKLSKNLSYLKTSQTILTDENGYAKTRLVVGKNSNKKLIVIAGTKNVIPPIGA